MIGLRARASAALQAEATEWVPGLMDNPLSHAFKVLSLDGGRNDVISVDARKPELTLDVHVITIRYSKSSDEAVVSGEKRMYDTVDRTTWALGPVSS